MSAQPFIHDDFLLNSPTAVQLYHQFAAPQPIIDYHCHLSPALIDQDYRFKDITELWLGGDHYKWRAMRADGVPEQFITGSASSWEKFSRWAATVPNTLRNPLYHWTHLELVRYFGITELLNPASARRIFDAVNEQLPSPDFSCRNLIRRSRVEVICTTDDPADSLEHHRAIAAGNFTTIVLPTWRPDKAVTLEHRDRFIAWLHGFEAAANCSITTYEDFLAALHLRHQFFNQHGCRLSDHGLNYLPAVDFSAQAARSIFDSVLAGHQPDSYDCDVFRMAVLHEMALWEHASGWTQQFHLGAARNNNRRMFEILGPDTGYDSIGDFEQGPGLLKFLDRLDATNQLPRTIVYTLNPRDHEVVTTLIGSFQDGEIAGKMQFGSAWWFLDQLDGMTRQMEVLSQLGLFSRFVGMLTDSRSFISYPRHEYFRRLLCRIIGRDVADGLLPNDPDLLGSLVSGIAYHNAREYFQFQPSQVAPAP